jgi:hypothetical protein
MPSKASRRTRATDKTEYVSSILPLCRPRCTNGTSAVLCVTLTGLQALLASRVAPPTRRGACRRNGGRKHPGTPSMKSREGWALRSKADLRCDEHQANASQDRYWMVLFKRLENRYHRPRKHERAYTTLVSAALAKQNYPVGVSWIYRTVSRWLLWLRGRAGDTKSARQAIHYSCPPRHNKTRTKSHTEY